MALFGRGNILLKGDETDCLDQKKASWLCNIYCNLAVIIALAGKMY